MKAKSSLFQTWKIYTLGLAPLGLSLVPKTMAASNFTDANWSSIGGFPGANGEVRAVVIDASGNLVIGGDFTLVGDVIANECKGTGHKLKKAWKHHGESARRNLCPETSPCSA